jgi:tRNA threonylcarbamoyladenosine biosynthesis protein TsaB
MYTLAFDTSSITVSVSILQDDNILYDAIINNGLNHSETLMPAIDAALNHTGIKIVDIDLFACTLGPGSFTGLRIGVSALKGFILATEKPAAGVSSLAALSLNIDKGSKLICPVMDAGRGQVYTALYYYNDEGLLIQLGHEKAISPEEILPDNKQHIIFVGDGIIKYAGIIGKNNKNIEIASPSQQHIRASAVGILGRKQYERGELLNPATFVPFYLRSADAQPSKSLF